MSIAVQCPGCGGRFSALDALAGKTVKCPRCRTAIAVSVPVSEMQPLASESLIDLFDEESCAIASATAALANPPKRRPRRKSVDAAGVFRNYVFPSLIAGAAVAYFLVLRTKGFAWLGIPLAITGGLIALYGYFAAPWVNRVRRGEPDSRPPPSTQLVAGMLGGLLGGALLFGLWNLRSASTRLFRQFGPLYFLGTVYLAAGALLVVAAHLDFRPNLVFGAGNGKLTARGQRSASALD